MSSEGLEVFESETLGTDAYLSKLKKRRGEEKLEGSFVP